MTPEEETLRQAITGRPTEGPWQIRMTHDKQGCTSYQVLVHTHAAICVAAEDYYAPDAFPNTDEDGYYQPDDRIDCSPHRVATARYIAAANPRAVQAILDDLDHCREGADRWEKRARSLGWSDKGGS